MAAVVRKLNFEPVEYSSGGQAQHPECRRLQHSDRARRKLLHDFVLAPISPGRARGARRDMNIAASLPGAPRVVMGGRHGLALPWPDSWPRKASEHRPPSFA